MDLCFIKFPLFLFSLNNFLILTKLAKIKLIKIMKKRVILYKKEKGIKRHNLLFRVAHFKRKDAVNSEGVDAKGTTEECEKNMS